MLDGGMPGRAVDARFDPAPERGGGEDLTSRLAEGVEEPKGASLAVRSCHRSLSLSRLISSSRASIFRCFSRHARQKDG